MWFHLQEHIEMHSQQNMNIVPLYFVNDFVDFFKIWNCTDSVSVSEPRTTDFPSIIFVL